MKFINWQVIWDKFLVKNFLKEPVIQIDVLCHLPNFNPHHPLIWSFLSKDASSKQESIIPKRGKRKENLKTKKQPRSLHVTSLCCHDIARSIAQLGALLRAKMPSCHLGSPSCHFSKHPFPFLCHSLSDS